MKEEFETARTLAVFFEWAGWAIVVLGLAAAGWMYLSEGYVTHDDWMQILATAFGALIVGLGMVLAGQLVRAQISTAENTSTIASAIARLERAQNDKRP